MTLDGILARWRDIVAYIITLLLSLILMNSSDHPAADVFRQGLQQVISTVTSPWLLVPRTIALWGENARLRTELVKLEGEQNLWRDAVLENIRLRRLLGFHDRPEFRYLAAEIVAKDPTLNVSSFILDKGRRDSVQVGQAVITADGLVGVIYRSFPRTSMVQLTSDRNFAASVRVERSRINGMIRWHGGAALSLDNVPKNLDVKMGDRIVTSGLGGIIPGGIPVGIVTGIERKQGEIFQSIKVRPFVQFASLEEVFVLLPAGESVATDTKGASP